MLNIWFLHKLCHKIYYKGNICSSCRDVLQAKNEMLNMLTDEVHVDLNVFGALMLNKITRNMDCTLVVIPKELWFETGGIQNPPITFKVKVPLDSHKKLLYTLSQSMIVQ